MPQFDDSTVIDQSSLPEGMGGEAVADTPSEKTVKITIGGVEYDAPESFANAYSEEKTALKQTQLPAVPAGVTKNEVEQMLADLRAPADDDSDTDEDLAMRLMTNPKSVLKEMRDQIENEVLGKARGEYSADQAQKKWWKQFYRDNNHLKAHDEYVQGVMQRNWQELGGLDPSAAQKRLSELASSEILQLVKTYNNNQGDGDDVHVESGRGPKAAPKANSQDEEKLSLSALLKKRQGDRQKRG